MNHERLHDGRELNAFRDLELNSKRVWKAIEEAESKVSDTVERLKVLQETLRATKRMGELMLDVFRRDDSSHSSTPQVQPPDERVSPDRPAADAPQAPSPTFPPADQPATKPNVLDEIREAIL